MHESHSVDSKTPCQYRNIHTKALCNLRAENACATKLKPSQNRMLDVYFDTWLCKWEVSWNILYFVCSCNFFCKHLQEAKKVSEVYIFSKYDSFCLVEVSAMSSINLIIAEASYDTEILSRNLSFCQLMS